MNNYYASPNDVAPASKARSVDINTLDASVDAAFDKLPDPLVLKSGTVNYAVDTGTVANTYLVAISSAVTGYLDGLEVRMRPTRSNTDQASLNVNGLGAVAIRRIDGTPLAAGDILANGTIRLSYSGPLNAFVLGNLANSQVASAAVSAAASAASAAVSQGFAINSSNSATASANSAAASAASAAAADNSAVASANSAIASANSATSIVRDGANGVPGLTGFWHNLFNAAGTIKSLLVSAATAARTWTFPDKSGTVALTSDVADPVMNTMNGGPLAGFRNKVINGDMRIDQRFNGAAVVPILANTYLLDRINYAASQTGKYNFQQNANGAAPPPGFTNYAGFVIAVTYVPISTDFFDIGYRIEGFDMQEFGWGAAGAKPVTISFWVRSAMVGQHSLSAANNNFDRTYPLLFNIPVADTWTYISVTIPGDTAGTWNKGNLIGLGLYFGLGFGSTFEGVNNTWNNGNKLRAVGAVNPCTGLPGNMFAITGLQVETGSVATPFERRPYQIELALCQRYYETLGSQILGNAAGNIYYLSSRNPFKVTKRAVPTVAYSVLSAISTNAVQLSNLTVDGVTASATSTGASNLCEAIGTVTANAEI